jgi:CRISPR system Cascade subunit CasE
MFLSKVTLQTRRTATQRLLADVYAQHRFVLSAFPDPMDAERAPGRESPTVLYRVETAEKDRQVFLLVQSERAPDWERACDLYPSAMQCAFVKEFDPECPVGRRFRFRLRANPTRLCTFEETTKRPGKRRIGIYREEEQREWFAQIATRGGFRVNVETVQIVPRGRLTGVKPAAPPDNREHQVQCHVVDFDGMLTVMEDAVFALSLRNGVGRGKAWGCGLLSLACC